MIPRKLAVQFIIVFCVLIFCLPSFSNGESSKDSLVSLVTDFYRAYQSGDVERMAELTHENIVWEAQESLPTGGTFVGFDEVVSNVFDTTAFYLPGFRIEVAELHQAKDVVFAITRVTADGIDDSKGLQVFYFEGRKIVRYMSFLDTIVMMSAANRPPD